MLRLPKKALPSPMYKPLTLLPLDFLKKAHVPLKFIFWFLTGIVLGIFLVTGFFYIIFQEVYITKVYPGVLVNGINFGGKTKQDVDSYFGKKNTIIENSSFTFTTDSSVATLSAKELGLRYDNKLLAEQAYTVGRSHDTISNLSLILQAYISGVDLAPSYKYNENVLTTKLTPLMKDQYIAPVDAIYTFENGRVTTFKLSKNGQEVDKDLLRKQMQTNINYVVNATKSQHISMKIPLHNLKPKVTANEAEKLGIKELVGVGESLFQGSIDTRIYNVNLGASRLNGVIIKPDEVFSFDKAIGDVSSLTGYKQAYVIENGKTVLGDGGGICQVSTTFFRAALNAGLPIIERHGHAYRVHYYEEDSPPGIDATIYTPTVDLKVKNDTGHALLVQALVDPETLKLTINLYGTSDGRTVNETTPVTYNPLPAPPDVNQDDPSLPKGQIKQVDFSAAGVTASFSRTVSRNGKILLTDKYTTVYRPWQAIYLHGTK